MVAKLNKAKSFIKQTSYFPNLNPSFLQAIMKPYMHIAC